MRRFGGEVNVLKTPSHALSAYFGLSHAPLSAHDTLDDALSLAYACQHLLREGRLTSDDFKGR